MRKVRCPQCDAELVWEESPSRPFCSERCRLIDLGAWLGERYLVPGEAAPDPTRTDDEEKP